MKYIYGTIGYTILKNINFNNKIIILADMHDTLPNCTNQTSISDWFKTKFKSSKILLEEVSREDLKLEELWSNSPHTQELKKLFINNPQLIHAIDIRPQLIPFSWELITKIENDISLKNYINDIDKFFCLKLTYFIKKIANYNKNKQYKTKLLKYFIIIKKKYGIFIQKYKNYINYTIKQIYLKKLEILYQLNNILDEIMEWYICANIILNESQPIILHTGLIHSEKVIKWLITHYNYITVYKYGINSIDKITFEKKQSFFPNELPNMSGCIQLPMDIDKQFGGFFN